jgi:hypothetical protein
MIRHYQSYYWNKGKPYGYGAVDPHAVAYSYKIVPDPYHRRFSIEKYKLGKFDCIIYDSFLLDFRRLASIENTAWTKELLEENSSQTRCLLRDPDDRAVLIETYTFEQQRCRSCHIFSIHGLLLAKQQLYYQALQDAFNGVVLYDIENLPVMRKTYAIDATTEEFSSLLTEEWNMQNGQTNLP